MCIYLCLLEHILFIEWYMSHDHRFFIFHKTTNHWHVRKVGSSQSQTKEALRSKGDGQISCREINDGRYLDCYFILLFFYIVPLNLDKMPFQVTLAHCFMMLFLGFFANLGLKKFKVWQSVAIKNSVWCLARVIKVLGYLFIFYF